MAFIQWDDSFSVGDGVLDRDHRKLIKMVNAIHDARKDGKDAQALGRLLDELIGYTETHFTREENLLDALGYGGLKEQKAEHKRLRDTVFDYRSRYFSGAETAELAVELEGFLKVWLINHILEEDMKYKPLFG